MITARPVSATDIAATVGVAHASASYDLRQLASVGLIEPVVATEPELRRSGRPKQLYRMSTDAFRGLGPRPRGS